MGDEEQAGVTMSAQSGDSVTAHRATVPSARPGRKWVGRTALVAGFVVVLVIGYAAGNNGKGSLQQSLSQTKSELSATQAKLAAAKTELATAQGNLISAQNKEQKEQAIAQQATQTADANAKAQYASQEATLKQEQQQLTSAEQTVKTEEGQLQASEISASGVYVVGQDIKSGTWHTNGDGGMTDNECYYATLNSNNTFDISDNNNFDGDETVDVSGVYAFQISGPCTWYYVG